MQNSIGNKRCTIPPEGWWCSRGDGHDGPCAARSEGLNPRIHCGLSTGLADPNKTVDSAYSL